MHVKMTLFRDDANWQDIIVTAEPTATVREVASRIAQADPQGWYDRTRAYTLQSIAPGGTEWRLLPPEAVIGEDWLTSGASVALVDEANAAGAIPSLRGGASVAVTFVSGAGAGATFVLGAGSHTVGRAPECDIVIDDEFMSKRHLRIDVGASVEVVDLGSANGVEVAGQLVPRLRVMGSQRLLAGSTELHLDVRIQAAARREEAAGPAFFNRSPRVEERYIGRTFSVPEVPKESEPQPFPLLAMITPMLLGFAMFAITQRPTTLLFVAMTPLMLIGNYVTGKGRDKRKLERSIAQFESGLEDLQARLDSEKITEQTARIAEVPSSEEVLRAASDLGPLMWTRRPEHWNFLNLRLGRGAMPSRNTIDAEHRGELLLEYQTRLDDTIERSRLVYDVPIVANLEESGAVGIAGRQERVAGSLAAALVQLTGLHSPAELVVTAAVTPAWARELDWLKWMPHTSSPHSPIAGNHLADSEPAANALLSELEELVAVRERANRRAETRGALNAEQAALQGGAHVGEMRDTGGYAGPMPAIVLVIADDVIADRARLVSLSERGADVGVFPLWVAEDVAALPAVCRTFVDASGDQPPRIGLVRLGEEIGGAMLDVVSPAQLAAFSRNLSRVIDAGAPINDTSDLPRSVSLAGLIDLDLLHRPESAVERWHENDSIHDRRAGVPAKRRRAGRLRATIGASSQGLMHLDLRAQGPHALVGGTTGAGKSEFLQAWVLGMAAEYSPDRVTFLFVDYKGGAAFADCVNLPHTVGLVTDLTPHLVRRALTSLRAELHHRELLLGRKGAKDLLELEKRGDPDSPPALILIIDEFAALVGEVPEFVDGVVDIAQRGRSLGIHLIMATQRPAGVIRDNLRANTNLRIALRMADESDSVDVIGEPDAAHFDPGIPGRAIAKTGPGRLHRLQSGYAGGWSHSEPESASIAVAAMPFGVTAEWAAPKDDETPAERDLGPTDQQLMVETFIAAAARAGIPSPRRPWLDELETAVDLANLRHRTDARLALGVSDLPDRQAQETASFNPDVDGHMVIYGTGGSGKSVALRTIAASAGLATHGGPVHVYGLDFGSGGLRMIEDLPHVGAVISGDDTERIVRLFRMLREQLDRRERQYGDASATSVTEFRQLPGRTSESRIVLLIDNFPSFRDEWEIPSGRNEWYRVFTEIIGNGRQLGVHVVFTADRPGSVPSSVTSGVQRRVVLRLADEMGYAVLDAPNDVLTEASPAGRALVSGNETQLAVLGGSSVAAEQSEAMTRLAADMRTAGAVPAPGIPSLPAIVPVEDLPQAPGAPLVLGLAEETLEPFELEPAGAFALAGPPGSGRSSALRVIAERLFERGDMPVYYIGNKRSALASDIRFAARATTIEDVTDLAKLVREIVIDEDATSRVAVIIEQLGDFLQSSADAPLVDLVRAIKREDHFAVAEAESSSWVTSWPLFGEFKSARRGLILQPDSTDGDVILKTSLPRIKRAEFPVGRGMLVASGAAIRVQLALASTPEGADSLVGASVRRGL
mgnify:CR=1 FL=1